MPNTITAPTPWPALLRLELANMSNLKRLIVLALVFVVLFSAFGGATFAAPMLGMFGVIAALTPWNADETYRLPQLYGYLPVRRRAIVASHYLFGALAMLASAAAAVVVALANAMLWPKPDSDPASAVALTLVALGAVALMPAFLAPLRLRFGQQASTYLTLGFFAVAGLIAAPVLQQISVSGESPAHPGEVQVGLWLIVAGEAVVCVLAWVVSYLISVRLYRAKDF